VTRNFAGVVYTQTATLHTTYS